MRLFNRFLSWRTRGAKHRSKYSWKLRWDRACKKCWSTISSKDMTKERIERFCKNHEKLMELIDEKMKQLNIKS